MDRRSVVATAGAAISLGCVRRANFPPLVAVPGQSLYPVRVADDRVIRTVVGLRPYRTKGFRVEAERLGEMLLVHNYGHGGGGVTLSWGTAHLAVELVLETESGDCAVMGCGAVGLATARLLQDAGRRVTVYAKDLPPNTTSNVAGAQWGPFTVVDESERTGFETSLERASRFAFQYFQHLVGDEYGVYWRRNFFAGDNPVHFPWEFDLIRDLFPEVRTLDVGRHPFPRAHVREFTTLHIEPARYLRAVLRDFLLRGGRVVVREFRSLDDVSQLPEPIVLNCTGLGARDLVRDPTMIPIKGQLTVLLPQPEVDYITIADGLYMMPRSDGVILGGTFERGVETLSVNRRAERRILDAHRAFFADMEAALFRSRG